MTRPRNRRAGARSSAGSTGRRPSRRASSSNGNPQAVIVGVAVVAVVAIVVAVFAFGGGGKGADEGSGGSRAVPPVKETTPAPTRGPVSSSGAGLPGKTPDRPAPTILAADLERAEQHYRNGVAKWNEGQGARNSGDSTRYAAALQDAFDEFEALRDALRPYTDWFEEADLEGWAMPAEYVDLQRRLDKYDRDYQKVKKLKQAR